MGISKSKDLVYSVAVPNTEDPRYSSIRRHPAATDIILMPTIYGCLNYYSLFQ